MTNTLIDWSKPIETNRDDPNTVIKLTYITSFFVENAANPLQGEHGYVVKQNDGGCNYHIVDEYGRHINESKSHKPYVRNVLVPAVIEYRYRVVYQDHMSQWYADLEGAKCDKPPVLLKPVAIMKQKIVDGNPVENFSFFQLLKE